MCTVQRPLTLPRYCGIISTIHPQSSSPLAELKLCPHETMTPRFSLPSPAPAATFLLYVLVVPPCRSLGQEFLSKAKHYPST